MAFNHANQTVQYMKILRRYRLICAANEMTVPPHQLDTDSKTAKHGRVRITMTQRQHDGGGGGGGGGGDDDEEEDADGSHVDPVDPVMFFSENEMVTFLLCTRGKTTVNTHHINTLCKPT